MNYIDFTITKSSLGNGRIYFEGVFQDFFPTDIIGGRGGDEHATGKVTFDAAGEVVETDIRMSSSTRLSPRKSFRHWIRSQQAAEGGKARLHRVSERSYLIEYLG